MYGIICFFYMFDNLRQMNTLAKVATTVQPHYNVVFRVHRLPPRYGLDHVIQGHPIWDHKHSGWGEFL